MLAMFSALLTVSCSLDDSIKGEYAGVEDEIPVFEILKPVPTDKITHLNESAFEVSGTCNMPGRKVRILSVGVTAGDTTCLPSKTFATNMDFSIVSDGTVTITGGFHDMPIETAPDSVVVIKETLPRIYLTAPSAVIEGNDLVFQISLSHTNASLPVSFEWSTSDTTATAGSDYTAVSTTTVTLLHPTSTMSLTVATTDDAIDELQETLSVNLANPNNSILVNTSGVGTIDDNDPSPSIFVFNDAVSEGQTLQFTVSLLAPSGLDVSFNYVSMDGSASVLSGDYTAVSSNGSIAAGQTISTIEVVTSADAVFENLETMIVSLATVVNAQVASPGEDWATGSITNTTPMPNLFVGDNSQNEDVGNMNITVSIDTLSEVDVTYSWRTYDGTALSAQPDYGAVGLTPMTLSAGSLNQNLSVSITADIVYEALETFTVSLSAAGNATISDATGLGAIQNDDATPQISISDASWNEGTTGQFVVTLNVVSGLDATFQWDTFNGSAVAPGDFASVSQMVTIPAGSQFVLLDVFAPQEGLDEFNEVMSVTLSSVINATTIDNNAVGTIIDQDAAPDIFIDDFALTEPDTVSYVVSLSAVSGKDVVFDYSSVDTGSASGGGTDFNNLSVSGVTIPAGTAAVTLSDANAVDDLFSEGAETYVITITSHTNSGVGDVSALVTINDNDGTPEIYLTDDTVTEGTTFGFVVSLSGLSASPVTFDFDSFDGTATTADLDYSAASSTHTISSGLYQITISMNTGADTKLETNETLTVSLSNVSASATVMTAGTDDLATGTINNDDAAPLLYIDDLSFAEESTGEFVVSLSEVSALDAVFSWQSYDDLDAVEGTDYTASTGTETIAAGNLAISVPVVALPLDLLDEPNEQFTLSLAVVSDAGTGDLGGMGTIIDNDGPPNLFIDDLALSEGDTALMLVSLAAPSGFDVAFDITSYNTGSAASGTDYNTITTTRLTIPNGNVTIEFSVVTLEDTTYEGDEYFDVSLSNVTFAGIGDGQGVVTIQEDDAQPILTVYSVTVTEGATLGFVVSLNVASDLESTFSWQTYEGLSGNVTIDALVADGDYTASSGSGTIAAGGQQFTIPVVTGDDSKLEGDEFMLVTLSSLGNVSVVTAGIGDQASGTIANDDGNPEIFIDDLSINEGDTLTLMVSLSEISGLPTVFTWNTYDGVPVSLGAAQGSGDYSQVTGAVATVPIGSLTVAVSTDALADALDEYDENYIISLSSLVNANVGDDDSVVTINDQNPVPDLFVADVVISEGDSAYLTISLDTASGREINFTLESLADTALGGGTDFNDFGPQLMTIPAGSVTVGAFLETVEDVLSEGSEQFYVSLSSALNANISDNIGVAQITDDDGSVEIYITGDSQLEGTDLVFTVSLNVASAFNVTYSFNAFDGTATTGDSDYILSGGTNTIPNGTLNQTITVATGNDTKLENDETFSVSLSTVVGATVSLVGTDDIATGTIQNNDSAPDLFIDDLSINEGETGTFGVSLSEVSGLPAVFNWQTFDGTATTGSSDYTGVVSAQVTIPAGSLTIADVSVAALTDALDESAEDFSITLAVVSDAGTGDLAAVGTINDQNSPPNIYILDGAADEGDLLYFVISLDTVSGLDVTFNTQTYDGTATTADSDYTGSAAGPITIPAFQGQFTVGFFSTEDTKFESNETMFMSLSSIGNATITAPGTDDIATGTINNDDGEPQLFIISPNIAEGGTLNFRISLSEVSALDVEFNFDLRDGDFGAVTLNALSADNDFTPANGLSTGGLTIPPGYLFRTITVVTGNDTKLEADERFTVSLSSLSGATIPVAGTDDVGTGTINNDDVAPFVYVNDIAYNEGLTGRHAVSLSEASGLPAVFNFTVYDNETSGADYSVLTNSMVTMAGGTTLASIDLHGLADGLDENNETYLLSLSVVQDLQVGDLEATGTINDMDSPPDLFIDDVSFLEGDTGTAVVTLSAMSGLDVTFSYQSFDTGSATGGGTDYNDIALTQTTIPAGSVTHTFDMVSVEDPTNEPDETFDVSITALGNAGSGDTDATMTIQNDDGVVQLFVSAGSGNEGSNVILTASISSISGVDVTFDWQTFDNASQAVGGVDYTAVTATTATIPSGQLTLALPVAATNDSPLDEDDETFGVGINSPGNATIVVPIANGTILDQDTEPLIYISDATAVNEGETFGFAVTLSKISGRDITLNWETLDGTALQASGDYTQVTSTPITFPAGTGTLNLNVVALTDAPLNEPTENLLVTLTALSNVTAGDVVASGDITDLDADPFIYIDDITAAEGDTSDLIISLSAVSAVPVTASLSYNDETAIEANGDYTNILVAVTVPVMTRVITLSAFSDEDLLNEATETFVPSLSFILNAQSGDIAANFNITDDDAQPGIYIADASAVTEGGTAQFVVSLGAVSGLDVDFTYNTTDDTAVSPDDFTAIASTTVTIPAGATQTTISVTTIDDTRDDTANSEYFNVTLTASNNGNISVSSGQGQIDDNDNPPFIFLTNVSGNEGETFVFAVSLDVDSENAVDFDYNTVIPGAGSPATAGVDYSAQTVSGAQIPAGSLTSMINITVAADNVYESTEVFGITITSTTATLPGGKLGAIGFITNTNSVPDLFTADAAPVTEGATSQFVVTLSHLADSDITFNWSTVDGTATDELTDTDYYRANALTATISALEDTITLSVDTNDDAVAAEGTENFRITLSGGSANVSIVDGHGQGDINDNEGAINIFITGDAQDEGTDLVFTVSIDQVSGFNVTYGFNSFDGTALIADGDYTVASGSGTLVAGATNQTITLTTGVDSKYETNETLTVSLSNVVGAVVNVVGTDDLATGTINNEDLPPNIFIDDDVENEGIINPFTMTLSQVSGIDVVFQYDPYPGQAIAADYTFPSSRQVTILPGALTVAPAQSWMGVSDSLDEFNETFLVSLTPISGISIVGSDLEATFTINDVDSAPTIYIADISLTEPDTVDFVVSLSEVSGKPIWFDYQSVDTGSASGGGTDFGDISVAATTIPAGQLNITLSGVNAVDDLISEGTETYLITLSNINNAGDGKNGATVAINDDEALPYLVVYGDSQLEGISLEFLVSLSGLSAGDVGFDFETFDNLAEMASDYSSVTVTSTISAGALQVTISVNTSVDAYYEFDETFTVTISAPTGAATILTNSAVGTITNDDPLPGLFVADSNVNEETTGYFTVSLDAISSLNSVFSWQTYDIFDAVEGTDYTASTGQGTITSGSLSVSIPVVALPADLLDEVNETFQVSLAIVTLAQAGDLEATGTIIDNDGAPNLFVTDFSLNEGESGYVTVSLSAVSGLDISFDVDSFDGSATQPADYNQISALRVTIPASSVTVGFQVVTQQDSVPEYLEDVFGITISNISNAGGGDVWGAVTIVDDDPMPVISITEASGAEGSTLLFHVTLDRVSGIETAFDWQSYDGSGALTVQALSGDSDYTPSSGSFTMVPGQVFYTVSVVTGEDTKYEADELFKVSLSNFFNVTLAGAGAQFEATGTINNDDVPPQIFVEGLSHNEGTTAPAIVSLSEVSGLDVTFDGDTYDGSPTSLAATGAGNQDYFQVVGASFTIPAGNLTLENGQYVASSDAINEYDENYLISFSNLVAATAGADMATITIVDQNPTPNLFVDDLSINEGDTGYMTVSVDAVSGIDMFFDIESYDNTATTADYTTITTTQITFPAGAVTIYLPLITTQDAISEGNHDFYVSLSSAVNANIVDDTGLATIIDDDIANIYIADAATVNEGDTLEFVVSLSTATAAVVTFDWETFDGSARHTVEGFGTSDYGALTLSGSIVAGELQVTLSVPTYDDEFVELAETMTVSLNNQSANASMADSLGLATINNTDSLPSVPAWVMVDNVRKTGTVFDQAYNHKYLDLTTVIGSESIASDLVYCNGIWALGLSNGLMIRSTDLINWASVDPGTQLGSGLDLSSLSCVENTWLLRFGNGWDYGRSSDALTWVAVSTPPAGGSGGSDRFVAHKGKVWFVHSTIVYSSDDLGDNFTPVITLGFASRYMAAGDDNLFLYNQLDEFAYVTDDEFQTNTPVSLNFSYISNTVSNRISFLLDGRLFLLGGLDYPSQYTDDFANYTVSPALERRDNVAFGNGIIFGRNAYDTVLYQSTDRGATFTPAVTFSDSYAAPLGSSDSWVVYGSPAIESDLFQFPTVSLTPFSAIQESAVVTITGMTEYQNIWAGNGAEVSISGGGGWQAGWGAASVTGGDTMRLRMTTAASPDTEKTTTVRIANRKVEWTTRTIDQVDLFIADASAVSEGGTAEFVVSLASAAGSDVTFDWVTVDGTATESDNDFAAVTTATAATIATGESQITISVATTQDLQLESDENFFVSLSNVNASGNLVDDLGRVSIINDDSLNIRFSQASMQVNEGVTGTVSITGSASLNGAFSPGLGPRTCAVSADRDVFCWGDNYNSRLGVGSTESSISIPSQVIPNPNGEKYQAVAAGSAHFCGLGISGQVYCWGSNDQGELGLGDEVGRISPQPVLNGASNGNFVSLGMANSTTCGLSTDGKLYCWGYNYDGILGNNSSSDESAPVEVSLSGVGGSVVSFEMGHSNACLLDSNDEAYCWGSNLWGKLGISLPGGNVSIPTKVVVGESPGTFKQVSPGNQFTCGLGTDDVVYCWGRQVSHF